MSPPLQSQEYEEEYQQPKHVELSSEDFLKYISTLKLNLTSPITPKIIKKQYHTLSLTRHPNKGGNVDAMKALNEAYDELKGLTEAQLDNFLKESKELLKAYKLFGILDEDNTFENIRKYYTRKNGNANKNILKLNSFDINEIIKTMLKVSFEHIGERKKYVYAMSLIEEDLKISEEEKKTALKEVIEEIQRGPKGGAKGKNPLNTRKLNGGAKRKSRKSKQRTN